MPSASAIDPIKSRFVVGSEPEAYILKDSVMNKVEY